MRQLLVEMMPLLFFTPLSAFAADADFRRQLRRYYFLLRQRGRLSPYFRCRCAAYMFMLPLTPFHFAAPPMLYAMLRDY